MTGPNSDSASIVGLAADVVAAYVSNNKLAASDLPVLIQRTFGALSDVHGAKREEPPKPATSIRKSVTDAHLVCLEDGERLKSLKRHLMSRHGLTPEEYRARWGLPDSYPMVAPAYAAARSSMAKRMGLGRGNRAAAGRETAPANASVS